MIDKAAQKVSVTREIAASPEAIFAVLRDPRRHQDFDGSDTVHDTKLTGAKSLELGSKFGMKMTMGPLPYQVSSTVKEFEDNRLIAWAHFAGHRWRYILEPTDTGTSVTEEFDWSYSKFPKGIEIAGYPKKHEGNMIKSLERLDALLTKTP